jgi:transposase
MESTGVLWRSPYEALEAAGFTADQLALVNARDVKAVIGRKTDREDAKRLAEIVLRPLTQVSQLHQISKSRKRVSTLSL